MSTTAITNELQINTITLKNRIVMPPLVIWESDASAEVKDIHRKHYASCAGPGLMIVEATTVSPEGKLHKAQLGIFEDRHIPGLKDLAETIRNTGAVPGIQLHHAGGRASRESNWGLAPLAPSLDGAVKPGDPECRELTIEDIRRIQGDFADAAERAVAAGFQVLELHGAHAYLGSQFLSPLTNTRTDQYGGSLENRMRFLLELLRNCRERIGDQALLSCRLGVIDQNPAGLSLEEGIETARRLEAAGADLLHISCAHKVPDDVPPAESDYNPLFRLAAAVKPQLSIPVIGVGGIIDPAQADGALKSGMADLVAVGRGILADAGWAAKAVSGRSDDIARCLQCSPCFWYKDPEKCPRRKQTATRLSEL